MSMRGLCRKRNTSQRDNPMKSNAKISFPEETSDSDSTVLEKDTLAIMYDIIMQIRNDPEYARSIYANCPRLQHLLEKRPDLRPIFEDSKFVRINFEDVFRKEGGVLPEDVDDAKRKKNSPSRLRRCVVCVVNHPLFKVLRVLLLIKKLISCIFGGGFAIISSLFAACFCDTATDLADLADGDADGDGDVDRETREQAIHEKHEAHREALNKAADRLEDPEVHAQMEELTKMDPDQLAEAVENDDNLRALRDSSPVCAELMSDPETMKIVCDPDNLRALGEAPELIEMDYADPDWTPPEGDLEMGVEDATAEGETGMEIEIDSEKEPGSNAHAEVDIEDGTAHERMLEDFEVENANENVVEEYELGKTYGNNSSRDKEKDAIDQQQSHDGIRSLFAQIGSGVADVVASELVGFGFREITGADDGLGGITETASAADTSALESIVDSDVIDNGAENIEGAMDEVEDTHHNVIVAKVDKSAGTITEDKDESKQENDEVENGENDNRVERKRYGAVGQFASRMRTAAKEYVAEAILGEDLGEYVVEKMEDKTESKNAESSEANEEDKEGEVKKRISP